MISLKAIDLRVGDEFTTDEGNTWWKVISKSMDNKTTVRLCSTCISSQTSEYKQEDEESATFEASQMIVIR